jgi:hypothetical protein
MTGKQFGGLKEQAQSRHAFFTACQWDASVDHLTRYEYIPRQPDFLAFFAEAFSECPTLSVHRGQLLE